MLADSYAFAWASRDGIERCQIADVLGLNSTIAAADGRFLIATRAESDLDRLTPAEISRVDPSSITLFPLTRPSEQSEDWSVFPPRIAARIWSPGDVAMVLIPGNSLNTGDSNEAAFRDCAEPIWEWMIRQVDRGRPVQIDCSLAPKERRDSEDILPRLVPSGRDGSREWLRSALRSPHVVESPQSHADACAVSAGLLQIHDFLDDSHQHSQSVEGQGRHSAGDYWHAIMHRREPDYGNSKYWFRRVGKHPLFSELADRAVGILDECGTPEARRWRGRLDSGVWDPFAFVDLCEACATDEDSPMALTAREIQWQEMRLLLRDTYRDAAGKV